MNRYKPLFESENRYGSEDKSIPEVDHLEVQLTKLLNKLFTLQGVKPVRDSEVEVYKCYRDIIKRSQNV
jgi:hypothetical protein